MQRNHRWVARHCLLALAAWAVAAPVHARSVPPLLYQRYVSFTSGASQLDLVVTGRHLARAQGMREARDTLEMLTAFQDSSGGAFERELMHAARDGGYEVPDALTS